MMKLMRIHSVKNKSERDSMKEIARIIKKIILSAAVTATVMIIPTASTYAATRVTIPVSQVYTTKKKVPSSVDPTFTYRLTANDNSYPMPGNTNPYEFKMTNSTKYNISIDYNTVGTYTYKLEQVIPSNPIARMTYDKKTYSITVAVKNNGKGLVSSVYISQSGSSYKEGSATFNNSYEGKSSSGGGSSKKTTTTTSTGGSGGSVFGAGALDSGVLGERMAPDGALESGVLGERKGPGTGDAAQPLFYLLVMITSAVVMVGAGTYSIKAYRR